MPSFVIIDADSIVYAAGFAGQTSHYVIKFAHASSPIICGDLDTLKYTVRRHFSLDKDIKLTEKECAVLCSSFKKEVDPEPLSHVLHTVGKMMKKIKHETKCSNTMVVLSGTRNFRYVIDPEYKANRKTVEKPYYYKEIREYLVDKWDAKVVDGFEADDAVGMLATKLADTRRDYVVASIDKDLDQIPGQHYNWQKKKHYVVTESEAKELLYTQLITGDATDNIKGLPKYGPVKAKKMLTGIDWEDPDCENEALRRIGFAYAIAFDDPEEEMFKTLQLVRILRLHPKEEIKKHEEDI